MAKLTLMNDHAELRAFAVLHGLVPVEMLPDRVDHVPSVIGLLLGETLHSHPDFRLIPWEQFFAKFDLLGLVFAYEMGTGKGELYQQYKTQSGEAVAN